MAEDDIVQRIIIQGADEAAAAFSSIGSAATQAMHQTGAAVDVSTEKLGSIQAAATRAGVSYDQMAARVAAASSATTNLGTATGTVAASVGQTSTALNGAATAAATAGAAFEVTRGEMRLMHEIAGELGVGPLASLGTILGKTTLELGALAAGVVGVGLALAVLVKFADEATKNVDALGRLADISRQSFEDLSAQQHVFEQLGVSSEQFNKEFTNLELEINKAAPQIADQVARSADVVESAFLKMQQAELNTRQVFQQGLQLNLQTQQLGLQLQQLQFQLNYQEQSFALQRQQAALTVEDAEANLRIVTLKRQLRDGLISQREYNRAIADEEEKAAKRAEEKAKLDLAEAQLRLRMLGEQQAIQRLQLQLQIQQAQQQLESNELAKEANKLAQQRAELDKNAAAQDYLKTQANDLKKIVGLMKQLADGQKEIKFDALTTLETKVKAVEAALIDAQKEGKNVQVVLANLLNSIPSTADAYGIGRALGLDDKTIAEMRAKGGAFIQDMVDKTKAANKALTESDRERFAKYEEGLNKLTANWNDFKTQAGAAFVAVATYLDYSEKNMQHLGETIRSSLVDAWGSVKEAALNVLEAIGQGFLTFHEAVDNIGKFIYDGFVNAFNSILSPIQNVIKTIAGWFQSLIDKAISLWNAIKGATGSAQGGPVGADTGGGLPMAEGGLFNGQRSGIDTNLVWLTSGEFIMSTNAVRAYGVGMMNAINSLRAPRFAVGGLNVPIPRLAGVTPTPSLSGQRTLNLTIEGRSFAGLSLPENTAQSLERFAVHSQIASAGRKQSWRR